MLLEASTVWAGAGGRDRLMFSAGGAASGGHSFRSSGVLDPRPWPHLGTVSWTGPWDRAAWPPGCSPGQTLTSRGPRCRQQRRRGQRPLPPLHRRARTCLYCRFCREPNLGPTPLPGTMGFVPIAGCPTLLTQGPSSVTRGPAHERSDSPLEGGTHTGPHEGRRAWEPPPQPRLSSGH